MEEEKLKKFMFYENFWLAINQLPIEHAKEVLYEFCKFGVTGILPEDVNTKMFCLGVSASVQKYQGRGGYREGSGRKKIENQNNQNNQKNQKNQKEQTETKTETKTETETKTKAEDIVSQYNNICIRLPKVEKITSQRLKHISARLKEIDIEDFIKIFEITNKSDFLCGINDRKWKASFDWIIENDTNYIKILEGKYNNRDKSIERGLF